MGETTVKSKIENKRLVSVTLGFDCDGKFMQVSYPAGFDIHVTSDSRVIINGLREVLKNSIENLHLAGKKCPHCGQWIKENHMKS